MLTFVFDDLKILSEPESLRMNVLALDHWGNVFFAVAGVRIAKGTFIAPAAKVGSGWLTIAGLGSGMAEELVRDFKKTESLKQYWGWVKDGPEGYRWLVMDKHKLAKMFPSQEIKES